MFRIQLTVDAKEKLGSLSDQLGITQLAITSKMVEFLTSQTPETPNAILGNYPKSLQKDIAKLILSRKGK